MQQSLFFMKEYSVENLKKICTQIRRDIIRMVFHAQSGHPGGSLGCVEVLVALYFKVMKHQPQNFNMDGIGEDLFFLSNGHITPIYYSVLARSGYFPIEELKTFRKINSRLQGHPATHEHLPGIRIASGSLGQGMSVAIGAALAKKLNNDDRWIFSLHGDGELQEGQIWEAAMFAAGKKIDNYIAIIDFNNKQIDGNVSDVMPLGNLKMKLDAFGWKVVENIHGNDFIQVIEKLNECKKLTHHKQPVVLINHTEMGYGVDFMMGTHKWHGKAPNEEQMKTALSQLEETLGDF